jgi:hypothetical protein
LNATGRRRRRQRRTGIVGDRRRRDGGNPRTQAARIAPRHLGQEGRDAIAEHFFRRGPVAPCHEDAEASFGGLCLIINGEIGRVVELMPATGTGGVQNPEPESPGWPFPARWPGGAHGSDGAAGCGVKWQILPYEPGFPPKR